VRGGIIDAPGYAIIGRFLFGTVDNRFQLSPAETISGVVVDSKGRPVKGAAVQAIYVLRSPPTATANSSYSASVALKDLGDGFTAKTDAKGRYTFSRLSLDGNVSIQLNDPRFVINNVQAVAGSSVAPLLTANICTTIIGKVVRSDGKPVGPQEVVAAGIGPGDTFPTFAADGSDGSYHLIGLAPGSYRLSVMANGGPGIRDWVAPPPITVTTVIGSPSIAPNLVLEAGTAITCIVVDGVSNQPVANVLVTVKYPRGSTEASSSLYGYTDKSGTYKIAVWPGPVSLCVGDVPEGYSYDQSQIYATSTAVKGHVTIVTPLTLTRD
jgi:hypothetical protein